MSRKLIYAINVTADGFADHEVMVADAELHDFFTGQLRSAGAALWGRVVYELMAAYWPFAPDMPTSTRSEIDFANAINRLPKIVFSNTLDKVDWENTRLVKGDAVEEVKKLKEQPGKDLQVGGLSFVSSLVDAGLVDEYWLLIHPVVLGHGKPLFNIHKKVDLKLVETRTFKSGVVVLHYVTV